jgi:hypothetical protein
LLHNSHIFSTLPQALKDFSALITKKLRDTPMRATKFYSCLFGNWSMVSDNY